VSSCSSVEKGGGQGVLGVANVGKLRVRFPPEGEKMFEQFFRGGTRPDLYSFDIRDGRPR